MFKIYWSILEASGQRCSPVFDSRPSRCNLGPIFRSFLKANTVSTVLQCSLHWMNIRLSVWYFGWSSVNLCPQLIFRLPHRKQEASALQCIEIESQNNFQKIIHEVSRLISKYVIWSKLFLFKNIITSSFVSLLTLCSQALDFDKV